MGRIISGTVLGLVALAVTLATGCNSQSGSAWSPFGPPTIPPPGAAQGPDANGYYPSPFVTPPPGATPGSTPGVITPGAATPPAFQPSSTFPRNGMGQTSSTSSDGLSWQTPRTGSSSPALATPGASIARAQITTPQSRAAEDPIRIVEASPSGVRPSVTPVRSGTIAATPANPLPSDAVIEISQLPKPRTTPAPISAVPSNSLPAMNRVRGFIPAVPQQNTVPQNSVPANSVPPTTARPRFSSSGAAVKYDAGVVPAGHVEVEPAAALQWRRP